MVANVPKVKLSILEKVLQLAQVLWVYANNNSQMRIEGVEEAILQVGQVVEDPFAFNQTENHANGNLC